MKKKRLFKNQLISLLIGDIICLIGSIIMLCNSMDYWYLIVVSSLLVLYAIFQIAWILTVLFKK